MWLAVCVGFFALMFSAMRAVCGRLGGLNMCARFSCVYQLGL